MRRGYSFIVLAAIAACVSVSPPRGDTNVPVTTPGKYKRETEQPVRIALATAARDGRIGATGSWQLFDAASPTPRFTTPSASDEWTVRLGTTCPAPSADPAACAELIATHDGVTLPIKQPMVVRPATEGSVLKWNGKRYRGELIITRGDSGLLVVNVLPMDSYLRGVVGPEIGARTAGEFAAVQVQAVAARTYAYTRLTTTRAFDMYATVQDQVYGGADAEKPQADSAVLTTRDVVIAYAGQPINAYYSSTCGGSTAGVTEVWNDRPDEPYLRPVSDRIPGTNNYYCEPSPRFRWTLTFDGPALRAVMEKYLATYTNAPKTGLGRITGISEDGRTASNRVAALRIATESGTYTLRRNDIRFVLRTPQGAILNSTYFSHVTNTNGREVTSLIVTGLGFGHGIGMCQWGVIGRARAGHDYRTILETYYPGARVGTIAS